MIGPYPPVHPGEVLKDEFLEPLGVSLDRLAQACRLPPSLLEAVIRCDAPVTADTALRLGQAFRTGPEF